jgi:mono/diheme cytochrome c family protein
MRRVVRWLAYAAGAILFLLLVAAAWIWLASERIYNRLYVAGAERLPAIGAAQRAEGARLTRVLGCFDCHGPGLRGKLMFDEPQVARVWAPNLTLLAAEATDAQLAQAIRQGIGHDGRALWIMPSGLFSRLSSAEVAAVVAAIRTLPRGGAVQPDIEIGALGRLGIATGKFRPAPSLISDFASHTPYYVGRAHEAGRSLAGKICAECHAPDLRGGQPGFKRTPPDLIVAGAYGRDDFRRLMRTGRPPDGRDLGVMRVAAVGGLSALRDDEIDALHDYLVARAERLGT